MRDTFGIVGDLTPDEQEFVTAQVSWAFDNQTDAGL
jgi:hypothetical protein